MALAGRGPRAGRDGSDRCGVGFRRAGKGRKAQSGRTKRGTCDPVPGCILPLSNQRARELAVGD